MKRLSILLLLLLTFFSCKKEEKRSFDLLLTNANIVDIENDSVLKNKLIAITKDTIRLIADMEDIENYEGTKSVDAENRFVMPGLWDNHVHFRGGDTLASENKDLLPLFLKYGVTTVRDAGGDISKEVFRWKKEIENEELTGPRIFASGPKLDGENPAWPGSISITSENDVQMALDSLEEMNVDYVKIYDGSITREVYYEIIREAEKRNLKVTGHMPMSADVTKAVKLGLDGTEHLYYVMKAASIKKDSIEKVKSGYSMIIPLAQTYNDSVAKAVFDELAETDFYVTPTLYIGKVLKDLADTDHSDDALLEFIGPGIQKTYQGRIMSAKRAKESGSSMRDFTEDVFQKMMRPMYNSGIKILAGSDCGPYNSFVYPGESLHLELEAMVNAGLTPTQALKTSVVNGPKFFGLEDSYGSISEGKAGDMIILDKNPLEDIKNTRSIKYVIKNNKVYTPGDLLKNLNN